MARSTDHAERSKDIGKSLERGLASRTGEPRACSGGVPVEELVDAAWEALVTGRPREVIRLETLLERPLESSPESAQARDSLARLEMLLAATARNLRVMRGQWQV